MKGYGMGMEQVVHMLRELYINPLPSANFLRKKTEFLPNPTFGTVFRSISMEMAKKYNSNTQDFKFS